MEQDENVRYSASSAIDNANSGAETATSILNGVHLPHGQH